MKLQQPHLVSVDPLFGFDERGGSLPVPGSATSSINTARFIAREGKKIDVQHIFYDTHDYLHWGHDITWRNAKGEHPTLIGNNFRITEQMLLDRTWFHVREKDKPAVLGGKTVGEHSLDYVRHVGYIDLWPVHCVPGTPDYNLQTEFEKAIRDWVIATQRKPHRIIKGYNDYTDQYGGIEAAFFLPQDHTTGKNERFFKMADSSDCMIWNGLEGTHCVMTTFEQAAKYMPTRVKDFVLLVDCIGVLPDYSSGGGPNFPEIWEEFLQKAIKMGATVTSSDNFRL